MIYHTADSLIPAPQKVKKLDGTLHLPDLKSYYVPPEFGSLAGRLDKLAGKFKLDCRRVAVQSHARLILKKSPLPREGFRITISNDSILLEAADYGGAIYAVNAFTQLLFSAMIRGFEKPELHCAVIEDAPRFAHRGLLLDSARHFQSPAAVKKLLHLMAEFRLNTLHWHLVDSQAWRLQLNTTAGLENVYTLEPGFYTARDIREITALASSLGIAVIPEIDMPGHSFNLLQHYPQYRCANAAGWIGEYCLGNDEAKKFLQNILQEVMELFPASEYIHIGGDEANIDNWEKCPDCRKALQKSNCRDFRELENKFMVEMAEFIRQNNRKPLVYSTNGSQVFPADVTVQAALDIREPLKHIPNGNKIIYSMHTSLYFDYPANLSEPWETWMFEVSERQVYMCDPYIIWPEKVKDFIIGIEACLWTETIPEWRVLAKTMPRIFAFSEAAWSLPEAKDYHNFAARKENLEAAGYIEYLYSL